MKKDFDQLTKTEQNAIYYWIGEHNVLTPTIADITGDNTLDLVFEDIKVEDGKVSYCQVYQWTGTEYDQDNDVTNNIYKPLLYTELATLEEMIKFESENE